MNDRDFNDFFKDEHELDMFSDAHTENIKKIEIRDCEKEKTVYKKTICALSAFLVFGFLVFLMFLSVVDKDKEFSAVEKRALAKRPAFSFSALFEGTWTKEFEDYYADNFPLRDQFIAVSNKVQSLLTKLSFGEDDSVIVKVKKNEDDFGGEGLTQPGQEANPEATTKQQETTTQGEKYADEKNAQVKDGSILVADKRAMEIFGYYEEGLQKYANVINSLADKMSGNAKVYSLVVPTAMEFYGTKEYRTGTHSQKDAINILYGMMNPNVNTVDAYSNLKAHSEEYIYFRTDHHWTARGAYYAYEKFCSMSGATPMPLSSYTDQGRIPGDFLGTLYAMTQLPILAENPDYVEYFMPQGVSGEIYQTADMQNSMSFSVVSKDITASNKYLAFIAGDQPLEKITTSAKNGKRIIVLKESYGNAFVPFLCNNYEEIYVLDPRKLTFDLNDFVVKNSINDVLFINYSFGVFNPTYLEGLTNMIQ